MSENLEKSSVFLSDASDGMPKWEEDEKLSEGGGSPGEMDIEDTSPQKNKNETEEYLGENEEDVNRIIELEDELLESLDNPSKKKGKAFMGSKSRGFTRNKKKRIPVEVEKMKAEAISLYINGKTAAAIDKLKEIVQTCPNYEEPYKLLGLIHYDRIGDIEKGIHFYTLAAQLSSDPKLWEDVGNKQRDAGLFESAAYSYGRALKSDANNTRVMISRAECYEKDGDLGKAIKSLKKALDLLPNDVRIAKRMAKLYGRMGRGSKGIEVLHSVLKENSPDLGVVKEICDFYLQDQRYEEASQFITKCLRTKYNQRNAGENAASKKTSEEITPIEMIKYFGTNSEDFPVQLITKLGICHLAMGEPVISAVCFNILLQKEDLDKYWELIFQVSEAYEKRGELSESLRVLHALESRVDKDKAYYPKLSWSLGLLHYWRHEQELAINYLQELISNTEFGVDARMRLSEIYREMGKNEEAIKILGHGNEEMLGSGKFDALKSSEVPRGPQLTTKLLEKRRRNQTTRDDGGNKVGEARATELDINKQRDYILAKYDFGELRLEFAKIQLLLSGQNFGQLPELATKVLIPILELELDYQKLKTRVDEKYIHESQKSDFKRREKRGLFGNASRRLLPTTTQVSSEGVAGLNVTPQDKNILFSSKRAKAKQLSRSSLLLKKKTKMALGLATGFLRPIKIMSQVEPNFLNTIHGCLYALATSEENYGILQRICNLMVKLDILKPSQDLRNDVYLFGVLVTFTSKVNVLESQIASQFLVSSARILWNV